MIFMRELEEVILSRDELEALRLKNMRNLDQNEAATQMKVSQPTFHRILLSAREKVTDALVNGKGIRLTQRGKR